jgi:hypothetical protein
VLLDHVPAGEGHLWGAWNLAAQGMVIAKGFSVLQGSALDGFCRPADLAEASRRDACDRIADMLVRTSKSPLGLATGIAIGKRVGWLEERLGPLQNESLAFQTMLVAPEDTQSLACGHLRAELDAIRESAEQGEVAVLRRRLAGSRG